MTVSKGREADMGRNTRWDIDVPFYIEIDVAEYDIDRLDHVNNSVYVQYMERAAWAHTVALGLTGLPTRAGRGLRGPPARARLSDRCQLDDRVQVATWIGENDGRLAMWRHFQMRRVPTGDHLPSTNPILTVRLSNGRPAGCRRRLSRPIRRWLMSEHAAAPRDPLLSRVSLGGPAAGWARNC